MQQNTETVRKHLNQLLQCRHTSDLKFQLQKTGAAEMFHPDKIGTNTHPSVLRDRTGGKTNQNFKMGRDVLCFLVTHTVRRQMLFLQRSSQTLHPKQIKKTFKGSPTVYNKELQYQTDSSQNRF